MAVSRHRSFATAARRFVAAAAIVCLVSATPARGQDGVLVGAQPAPGQSQRVRVTQTMSMAMTPDGPPPPGFPAGGLHMEQSTITVIRQDIALVDGEGRTRIDVTYESMTQTATMNGREMPLPAGRADVLNGKTFTLWLDAKNEVADVTVPEGTPLTNDQAKQLLASTISAMPRRTMHVGETVTRPLSLDLPVPAGSTAAPRMSATTTLTLTGIDGVGTDRAANFSTVFDGTLGSGAAPGPAAGPDMSMTLGGTGTMRLHLLSGFITASTSDQTIDGTLGMPGGGPALTMRGKVHMVLARLE